MEKSNLRKTSLIVMVFLILLSCNIPNGNLSPANETSGADIFETARSAADATLTELAMILPSNTATVMVVDSTLPPPISPVTPTSSKPMVTVSKETNCRSGQGTIFEWVGSLKPGETAEVVAMDTNRQYYYIRNPLNQASFCWLWGNYATTSGDYSAVPLFTPMPTPTLTITPTLTPDFSVVDLKLDSCVGWTIQVKVNNTGSITWSSGSVIAKDNVTSTTLLERTSNQFEDWNGCLSASPIQGDLAPGEIGSLHSFDFMSNPAGHAILLTIKLCSMDGMAGSCITKQVTFTP